MSNVAAEKRKARRIGARLEVLREQTRSLARAFRMHARTRGPSDTAHRIAAIIDLLGGIMTADLLDDDARWLVLDAIFHVLNDTVHRGARSPLLSDGDRAKLDAVLQQADRTEPAMFVRRMAWTLSSALHDRQTLSPEWTAMACTMRLADALTDLNHGDRDAAIRSALSIVDNIRRGNGPDRSNVIDFNAWVEARHGTP